MKAENQYSVLHHMLCVQTDVLQCTLLILMATPLQTERYTGNIGAYYYVLENFHGQFCSHIPVVILCFAWFIPLRREHECQNSKSSHKIINATSFFQIIFGQASNHEKLTIDSSKRFNGELILPSRQLALSHRLCTSRSVLWWQAVLAM